MRQYAAPAKFENVSVRGMSCSERYTKLLYDQRSGVKTNIENGGPFISKQYMRAMIPLINGAVDVWRPVYLTHVSNDTYIGEDIGYDPNLEEWLAPPGAKVRCEY